MDTNNKKETKKINNKKVFVLSVIMVVVLIVITVFTLMPEKKQDTAICNSKEYSLIVESDADAEKFVEQFFEAEQFYSLQQEYVPIEFDDVYNEYNELQKMQGLDLERYKGAKCKLYIYKLAENDISDRTTYMSMLVYEERVIGGHISTMTQSGEMYTFDGEKYV